MNSNEVSEPSPDPTHPGRYVLRAIHIIHIYIYIYIHTQKIASFLAAHIPGPCSLLASPTFSLSGKPAQLARQLPRQIS